ncbi:MAG: DUF1549 domain-containing protein [Bryobacteraceae bacterium]|nr:DUF1549 domain-containing protein [Bryobacteraceae bacterium]
MHPILAARCLSCHSGEKRSGGLSLGTYAGVLDGGRGGAAVRPGDSSGSLLLRRINGEVAPAMPLGMPALAPAEIATVRRWIDEGARETPKSAPAKPKWEPPLELTRPEVPATVWAGWSAPLDRFAARYMAAHGMKPPPPVSDAVFARRVYLDVWGLLPTPEELQAFGDDRGADKREKLIERLLADEKKYAENWISFWNDLLRNDEGVNYAGSRKSITGWLAGALESNLPYHRFVARLLDPKGPDDPEGFLVGVNWRGDISASQTPAMQAAQNTAQVFLGINLKCNSCHDSFISRWKLKDAYALAGYFADEPRMEMYRCDAATGQFAEPAFLYPELDREIPSASAADRRATASAIFTDPRNGRLPRTLVNRVWQRLMGRGIVDPPDEMDAEPWSPELLDWLAGDFAGQGYDMKRLIATILTSRTYQMPAAARMGEQPAAYVFRGPEVRRMTAEQFADAIGSITGEWRVYQPDDARRGAYAREWHLASSPMTRALGRPIRDQVVTTRAGEATTLQALELVNGETLTRWLSRGARKMLGELPPEPESVFDSGTVRGSGRNEPKPVAFDVDIAGADKVWLVVQDVESYEADRVEPVWAQAEFVSPGGVTPLQALTPASANGLRSGTGPLDYPGATDGLRVMSPSTVAYEVKGRGFTRFRGSVVLEKPSYRDDIMPKVRFFVFREEPNMERLVPVAPETPVAAARGPWTADRLADRVLRHALGRAPTEREQMLARSALEDGERPRRPSAAGLADLLWALMMSPDFQLIY